MFQLIILLKPDFNCCNNLQLSLVDKVTTGTNFPSPVELVITQVEINFPIN